MTDDICRWQAASITRDAMAQWPEWRLRGLDLPSEAYILWEPFSS